MSSTRPIEVERLTKRFGDFVADDAVSFSVEKGKILGLLGPNGAGKTTLIRMLTTLLPPTSGTARVEGHDIVAEKSAVRRSIGMSSMPGGTWNSFGGASFSATFMNSVKIGAASTPPVMPLPIGRGLS